MHLFHWEEFVLASVSGFRLASLVHKRCFKLSASCVMQEQLQTHTSSNAPCCSPLTACLVALQMRRSSSSGMLSQPLHPRELPQQGCAVVPREQFLQLQQQLLQAEQRGQRLQEELESRPSETHMQQVRLSFLCRLQWGVGFVWCFDF